MVGLPSLLQYEECVRESENERGGPLGGLLPWPR